MHPRRSRHSAIKLVVVGCSVVLAVTLTGCIRSASTREPSRTVRVEAQPPHGSKRLATGRYMWSEEWRRFIEMLFDDVEQCIRDAGDRRRLIGRSCENMSALTTNASRKRLTDQERAAACCGPAGD